MESRVARPIVARSLDLVFLDCEPDRCQHRSSGTMSKVPRLVLIKARGQCIVVLTRDTWYVGLPDERLIA